MNASSRIFIVVEGGHVTNVDIPRIVDGTHTVLDFDDAEDEDKARSIWDSLDAVDRAYALEHYPELCESYFGEFAV
jgi:hypothetical protein